MLCCFDLLGICRFQSTGIPVFPWVYTWKAYFCNTKLALTECKDKGKQAPCVQVIVYQPQHGRGGQSPAMHPLQHTAAEQQAQASGLSSYAPMPAASVKPSSNAIHASHPQQPPQQQPHQELQPQHLMPQPSDSHMQPQYPSVSTHAPAFQSTQQQQPAASRQPGYATGISSLPPHMPPSSTLLSSHASHPLPAHPHPDAVNAPMQQPSRPAFPGSMPPGLMQHQQQQQQQQMMGQHQGGQASSWPLQAGLQPGGTSLPPQQQQQAVGQGLAARQATAEDVERMQQRPASVPANPLGESCVYIFEGCLFMQGLVREPFHSCGFHILCLKSWHAEAWHLLTCAFGQYWYKVCCHRSCH